MSGWNCLVVSIILLLGEHLTLWNVGIYGKLTAGMQLQASRGFIALERPEETYGLRPGRQLVGHDTSQVYGVSMFHQLHCLVSHPV